METATVIILVLVLVQVVMANDRLKEIRDELRRMAKEGR